MINSIFPSTIRAIVARYPGVVPHLSRNARIMASIKANISAVNKKYHDAITEALIAYFEGGGSVTAPRSRFQRAMVEAFGEAFDTGWIEGGGEDVPDKDALDWLNTRIEQENGFIDGLFQEAKELRKDPKFDYFSWINSKADGYTSSLPSVYNAAKLLANDKQMLWWHYGDTDHCDTCLSLNGKKHRAAWYLERDYIPGKPGAAMQCGGYRCQCWLTDKDGNEITI